MKILKKGGGSREKGGGGNEIHAPCACEKYKEEEGAYIFLMKQVPVLLTYI